MCVRQSENHVNVIRVLIILGVMAFWTAVALLAQPLPVHTETSDGMHVNMGPHLFLDDALIAETSGVVFTLHTPGKYEGNPIIRGDNPYTDLDKTSGPFTVQYTPEAGTWQMWYTPHNRSGLGYHIGTGTSSDGIRWDFPDLGILEFQGNSHNNLVIRNAIGGAMILDPDPEKASERYKGVFYRHKPEPPGFSVSFSPDGLHWSPLEFIEELDDRAEKLGTGASDIVNVFYDSAHEEFVALFKMWSLPGAYNVPVKRGTPAPECRRRIVGMSRSRDFRTWSKARSIVQADDDDPPTLEFYGISSVLERGGLFLGFIPCLIDDAPPDGIGWTELIISRDGSHWSRIRQPFLQRSQDDPKAPDHAIAWISEVASSRDREFIYYTGNEYGHKTGSRAGLLAFLRKDGFVSVDAGKDTGLLITKPLCIPADVTGMSINARGREIRVQLSQGGVPLKGYTWEDCDPIRTDSISAAVKWHNKPELPYSVENIQISFRLHNAELYSFSFHS